MDEVIFDPSGKSSSDGNSQETGSQQPVTGQNPQDTQVPPEPNLGETVPPAGDLDTGQQAAVEGESQAANAVVTAEEGVQQDGGEYEEGGNPPRIGGGLWKKIIIGVIVVFILIFVTVLLLPKGASNENVKLIWWGLWEDQRVVKPLIDEFQKEHPNISVEYVKQDPKQYREKLQARIKNGTGPDVFRFHNTWVPMLSEELLPLSTDVMSPNEFKSAFYPVMQKDLTKNGAIYGIPMGADSLSLFVNTELLEAAGLSAPKTWEEFVRAARTLTVKADGRINTAGAAMGTFGNVTHAPDIISLLFIQQGIDIKNFPNETKSDKVDALNFYTAFAEGEQNVWDSTLDESLLAFSRGNLAMYFGYSWDVFRIKGINKDLPFEIHPAPQLVGREASLASYWIEGISAKSKNQKEALVFMQYLARKETNQKFYTESSKTREFGEAYARRDLAESLKDNKVLYPFVEQLGNASSSVFASDTYDGEGGINSLSNTYLGNAINSMINENSSADSVVDTLDQGISQVYQKYGVK